MLAGQLSLRVICALFALRILYPSCTLLENPTLKCPEHFLAQDIDSALRPRLHQALDNYQDQELQAGSYFYPTIIASRRLSPSESDFMV